MTKCYARKKCLPIRYFGVSITNHCYNTDINIYLPTYFCGQQYVLFSLVNYHWNFAVDFESSLRFVRLNIVLKIISSS